MSENLEFQCAINRADTRFLGRKYGTRVLPTVLMPRMLPELNLGGFSRVLRLRVWRRSPYSNGDFRIYINWVSPNQL